MNDILSQELEDLRLFADPFEAFSQSLELTGWTARFVRKGDEIALRRDSDGTIKTLLGPGQRKYRTFTALLVSASFANLSRLARAQLDVTKALVDPTTGHEKPYLPNTGDIESDGESTDLTFDSVCERLERRPPGPLRVFVVNGAAGVGKSYLIERIVRRRAAPHASRSGTPLFLHVESRGKVLTSLSDRIAGTLASLRASFVEEELKPLIRRGAVQVAIDGFDELSDSRGYVRAWGALRDFIRDLRGHGTCVLAGRDTMLDAGAVSEGLGHTIADGAVTFLRIRHPPATAVRKWLSRRTEWTGRERELDSVERQVHDSEYLRRPFFIAQIAQLGPERFQDAQGEPIAELLDGIVRREGPKLIGTASDIDPERASELYGRVLSETARIMMDDETSIVEVEIVGLLIEETFADYADQELINALVQRAGTLGLLEVHRGEDGTRSFPHETVRSYFFAQNICECFAAHGPPVGLHRVPLGAEDFRIFNRVVRRKSHDDQRRLRESLRSGLREANSYDYLSSNIGGLLLAFAPLNDDETYADERLVLANIELRDAWMADLLGAQKVSMDGCTIHRLDVRGADLSCVHFVNVQVFELLGDPYVKFAGSAPKVSSVIVYESFKERRWKGAPDEWISLHTSSVAEEGTAGPDEKWYLLEKFARISMRQYAIRSGRDNNDPAARAILESRHWPDVRKLLEAHGRLETPDNPSASGPRSEWFHLVAGAEFLDPSAAAVQDSTLKILEELHVGAPRGYVN